MMPRLCFLAFAALFAAVAAHAQTTVTRPVAQGVTLTQTVISDGTPDGPQIITIIHIDPKESGVKIEAALGQDAVWGSDPTMGREAVSTMVSRHKAVAGVNAGFFPFMGNPLGLHIQNGEVVTEPIKNRTVFYMDKSGVPHLRAFAFAGTVRNEATGETLPLSGLNRKASVAGDELLLYTPVFQDKTLRSVGRTEAVLSLGKKSLTGGRDFVAAPVSTNDGGLTPLKSGTMVLSGIRTGADFIKRAADAKQRLAVRLDILPLPNADETAPPPVDISQIQGAVTGAPRLVTSGKITIRLREESMGNDFSTTRHPRTAVGITKSGKVLLVTVDGRQKGLSRGMSLPELANLLLKEGAVDAVNLDGGGSSAAVVRGMVVNSPSSGAERPIADAIIVSAKNTRPISLSRPSNAQTRVFQTGQSAPLTSLITQAAAQNGVWGTLGGVGFVYQNGDYVAQRPGKGTVLFAPSDGQNAQSLPVLIQGAGLGDAAGFTAKLTLTPDKSNPLRATLHVHIANAEGDPLGNEPVAVSVTGGKTDAPTVSTDAKGNAQISITWDANSNINKVKRAVSVTSPAKRFADAQTELPSS